MAGEGVQPGVADLFLMKPFGQYAGMFIEIKQEQGRQTKSQKDFEAKCVKNGYKYVICRGLYGFMDEVRNYLKT